VESLDFASGKTTVLASKKCCPTRMPEGLDWPRGRTDYRSHQQADGKTSGPPPITAARCDGQRKSRATGNETKVSPERRTSGGIPRCDRNCRPSSDSQPIGLRAESSAAIGARTGASEPNTLSSANPHPRVPEDRVDQFRALTYVANLDGAVQAPDLTLDRPKNARRTALANERAASCPRKFCFLRKIRKVGAILSGLCDRCFLTTPGTWYQVWLPVK